MSETYLDKKKWVFIILFLALLLFTKAYVMSDHAKSRLATVQAIVEQQTTSIDNTLYHDTIDRVYVDGRFYSDKPIIMALLTVPLYYGLYHAGIGMETEAHNVHYLLTFIIMGGTTMLMLFFFYRILELLKIKRRYHHVLAVFLVFGTLALPYALIYNAHLLTANLSVILFYYVLQNRQKPLSPVSLFWVGFGAALLPGIDTIVGGAFFVVFSLLLLVHTKQQTMYRAMVFLAGAFFPLLITFGYNYIISDSIIPFSGRLDLFTYPGTEFDQSNLSGVAGHESVGALLLYGFNTLFGSHGLFLYTPILILSVMGLVIAIIDKKNALHKEAWLLGLGMLAIILFYIVKSTNYGGSAYGMRWFVAFMPVLYVFIVAYLGQKPSTTKLYWFYILGFVSLFVALVGVYEPWTNPAPQPATFKLPSPLVNNLRFLFEDVVGFISPELLAWIKDWWGPFY